jgi:hypothetical protein
LKALGDGSGEVTIEAELKDGHEADSIVRGVSSLSLSEDVQGGPCTKMFVDTTKGIV